MDYLTSFYHRSQPLFDVDGLIQEIRDEFEKKWESGNIEGWSLRQTVENEIEEAKKKAEAEIAARKKAQAENINDIDDDDDRTQQEVTEIPDFSSIESIEKMGMEKLKEILQSMGAKCGYVITMSIN